LEPLLQTSRFELFGNGHDRFLDRWTQLSEPSMELFDSEVVCNCRNIHEKLRERISTALGVRSVRQGVGPVVQGARNLAGASCIMLSNR
jgi:hypothetical protein